MIRDLDIYRPANVLIREHGEEAALEAFCHALGLEIALCAACTLLPAPSECGQW